MHAFFRHLRLFFAACLLTACSPARTGIIGNTLTTNVKPAVSITGASSFTVMAHGKLWPEVSTDIATAREMLSFDFALFADAGIMKTAKQADRFAYAAIIRISGTNAWRFQPTTRSADAFTTGDIVLDGIDWDWQLMRTPSRNDWPSAVWEKNGKDLPQFWLAKRWTAHLNDSVRAVMEYREPWPECIHAVSRDMLIMPGMAGDCLKTFIERADAAFTVEKKRGNFQSGESAPPSMLALPSTPPNLTRLVGEVVSTGSDS